MTVRSPTVMRCERCKAVISAAQAAQLIRRGAACGVCGGTLVLWHRQTPPDSGPGPDDLSGLSVERRLLGVLRDAHGRPVGPQALAQAGISDPAAAIYELERAGHRIERRYSDTTTGPRRFLGYRVGPG
jgi:hypothetical protein